MKALLLTEPHANLIYKGEKKLILKKKKYNILGKTFYLSSTQGTVYGTLTLTKRFEIDKKAFAKLQELHKVSEREMKDWKWTFPLYAFEFNFRAFKKPKKIEIPRGAQTFLKDVHLVRLLELVTSIKNYDPKKPNNQQLADDWRIVCAWYSRIKRKKKFVHSEEDILNLARIIYLEIKKRVKQGRMKHEFKPSQMTKYSKELYNKVKDSIIGKARASVDRVYAPVFPSRDHLKGRNIKYDEVTENWKKPIVLVEDFVSVIGGVCNWKETTGDIDILLKMPKEDNFLATPLIFRLYRAQPEDIANRLHFVKDLFEGPFTDHAHIYDLALIPKQNVQIHQMSNKQANSMKGDLALDIVGSKTRIAKYICSKIPYGVESVADAFAGSCATAWTFKQKGYKVFANDIRYWSKCIQDAVLENTSRRFSEKELDFLISSPPFTGFLSTFQDREFWSQRFRTYIDGFVERAKGSFKGFKKAIAFAALGSTMNSFSSYSGSSYGKTSSRKPVSLEQFKNSLKKRVQYLQDRIFIGAKECRSSWADAFKWIPTIKADLIYLDPPYISYASEQSRYKAYDFQDKVLLQKDVEVKEVWNKNNFKDKLEKLFKLCRKFKYILLSYKTTSFLPAKKIASMLKEVKANVRIFRKRVKWTITPSQVKGAKEKFGEELLFLATNEKEVFFADEILQRVKSSEIARQAEESKKEGKVKPFRFFLQMKPMHGRKEEEFYSPETVLRTLNKEVPDWKELGGVYVGRKADGCTCQFHKVKDKVRVWIEDGGEITHNIPTIVNELKTIKHDFVSIGEIEHWKNKTHSPRAVTVGILHTKEVDPEEKNLKVAMYDVFWLDGKDIHKEDYVDRRKEFIKIFSNLKTIWINPNFLAKTDKEVISLIKKCARLKDSEGAILNVVDQKYNFALEPSGKFMKFKNEYSLVAKVIGKHKVKGSTKTFSYYCAIEDDCFIGKTFNTNVQAKIGDKIEVIFVDISAYYDKKKKKYWFRWWSPRVKGRTKKPLSKVRFAMYLVRKTTGRIEEKKIPKFEEIEALPEGVPDARLFQTDPFMEIPQEKTEKTYKFVMQHHYRAGLPTEEADLSSAHVDFRFEVNDYLVGWTLADQVEGKVTEVRTMIEARDADRKPGLFKVNWKTGKFKIHVTKAGHKVRRSLFSAKKSREPKEWLYFRGVVKPGTVGATRYGEGVFTIIDKGTIELGTQKPYFHEYFLHGDKMKGRLVFRQLPTARYKKVGREEFFWLCIQPLEQEPYVLSNRAEKEGWLPPANVSALPENIRRQVPSELHYWKLKERSKARKARSEIRKLIKKGKITFEGLNLEASTKQIPFILQHHWFKGQKVIRAGPTTEHWDLMFNFGKAPYPRFICEYNPLKVPKTASIYKPLPEKCFQAHAKIGYGETFYAAPGTVLNPTKDTPSWLKTLDRGKCVFLEKRKNFMKIQFKGKKLKELYVLKKEPEETVWILSKSVLPKPELSAEFMGKDSDYLKIEGILLHRGKFKSKNFRVTDEALKKAVLEPLEDRRLCYVDLFHSKEEFSRVGILNKIRFDPAYEWVNEESGEKEKGALLYEAFLFHPDTVEKVAHSEYKFTSAELKFVESPDRQATNLKIYGLALVLDPAVKEARIATAQDQNSFIKFHDSVQMVRIINNIPIYNKVEGIQCPNKKKKKTMF